MKKITPHQKKTPSKKNRKCGSRCKIVSSDATYYKKFQRVHPLAKYLELQCYQVGAEKYREPWPVPGPDGSVAITRATLKELIKSKDQKNEIITEISRRISRDLSADQKILAWDYIWRWGLPKHIDLEITAIPPAVWRINQFDSLRAMLELGFLAGHSILSIWDTTLKDNARYDVRTPFELEVFYYYFFNLWGFQVADLFRIQLHDYLTDVSVAIESGKNYWQWLRAQGTYSNIAIEQMIRQMEWFQYHHSADPQQRDYRQIVSPYLCGDRRDCLPWSKLCPGNTQRRPLASYKTILKVLCESISAAELISGLRIIDPITVDIEQEILALAHESIKNSLELMYNGTEYETHLYLRNVALPISKLVAKLGLKISRNPHRRPPN